MPHVTQQKQTHVEELFLQMERQQKTSLAALRQHILRVVSQATKWHKCFEKQRIKLDPSSRGWEKVDIIYLPF